MSICINTGLPHAGDDCPACVDLDHLCAATRRHPTFIAADAASKVAWEAYNAGRDLPEPERFKLECMWRAAIENSSKAFSAVFRTITEAEKLARASETTTTTHDEGSS